MGREYTVCDKCGDLLPDWMDGEFTCKCGTTTVENDIRVDCSVCGKSIKEYDARSTSYYSQQPSGGALRSNVYFCEDCNPNFYEIILAEEADCFLPMNDDGPWETEQTAALLSKLPKKERVCSECGAADEIGDYRMVGAVVLPGKHLRPGDEVLNSQWIMRPLCLGCRQKSYPER